MPKSSIARNAPSSRTVRSTCTAEVASCISAFSVTSRHSADGGIPDSSSARRTIASSCGSPSWRGERLALSCRSRPVAARSSAHSRVTVCSMNAPRLLIKSLSSASGMNSPGETVPCCGWFHRSR